MTITRFLAVAMLAVLAAAPGLAQSGDEATSSSNSSSLIPSVQPVEYTTAPAAIARPETGGMPPGRPQAAAMQQVRPFTAPPTTVLDQITNPAHSVAAQESNPVGTLTGQPLPTASTPPLPPGSYPSPFYTDGPGCCGPLGRDGRIGYELYTYTGPTWAIGEGEFTRRLQTGWMVGGGGRSLFFDQSHTKAWVIDLGLSYQYNRGEFDDPISTDVKQIPIRNPLTGAVTQRPDVLTRVRVRALDRTNFNYGIGHDWWLSGAATPGLEDHVNWRVGALVGGRWGTAHVDLVPLDDPTGYARRHNVTHGVFVAAHSTVEVPMGSWILFAGLRAEWGYDWTNIVPPMDGNMHSINLMMTSGIRY